MKLKGFSLGAFLRPLLMESHSPHACSIWDYTHSLSHSSSVASLPFQGLGNKTDQEFSDLCSWWWNLSRRKSHPNKLSHLERVAHRPDNLPLQLRAWQPASSTSFNSIPTSEDNSKAQYSSGDGNNHHSIRHNMPLESTDMMCFTGKHRSTSQVTRFRGVWKMQRSMMDFHI